jgi:hypothetical protein
METTGKRIFDEYTYIKMNICARKRPGFYAPGKVRKTASFAIIPA